MVANLVEVFTTMQSQVSSGSGTGVSYYKNASECYPRVLLAAQHKFDLDADEAEEASDARKPIGRIVGTYGHALQQIYHEGRLPETLVVDASEGDIHFREAVRCMRAYRKFYAPTYFGQVIGCEVKFPQQPDEAALLEQHFGGPFTLRADMVNYLDQERVDELELTRGIVLDGPGLYFVDHKFLWQIDAAKKWDYQFGMQSVAYPVAYKLLHEHFPERYPHDIKGMIFNCMSRQTQKEENFTEKHFQLFVSQFQYPEDIGMVASGIRIANLLKADHEATGNGYNTNACIGKWGPCPMLKLGQCSRGRAI
jgi:hypothetical protein